ncbi:hypothetical protein [Flavobacterium alkalisoli]|uniref:hypothetical protein n=1 Tax=Flavobacterium alkalisoli TaxID=2602769 RepID=UPI003A8D7254
MRILILLISLCISSIATAQNTTDLNNFFNQISTERHYKIKRIEEKKIEIDTFELIFLDKEHIKKYISDDDIEYFRKQIMTPGDTLWQKSELKDFKLLNKKTIKRISHRTMKRMRIFPKSNFYYSFSAPIFSLSGEYALIEERFHCGLMCAEFSLSIYRKDPYTKEWKKFIAVFSASS